MHGTHKINGILNMRSAIDWLILVRLCWICIVIFPHILLCASVALWHLALRIRAYFFFWLLLFRWTHDMLFLFFIASLRSLASGSALFTSDAHSTQQQQRKIEWLWSKEQLYREHTAAYNIQTFGELNAKPCANIGIIHQLWLETQATYKRREWRRARCAHASRINVWWTNRK